MRIFLAKIDEEKWNKKAEDLLSAVEKERLAKTTSIKAKSRFIAGRFLIKTKFAEILNCSPQEIILKISKSGRLELESPAANLSFNISHSHQLIVLAVSESKVGVDIEFQKKRNFLEIAEEFFTPEEFAFFKKISDENERQKLFYQIWTRTEAVLKCNGEQLFNRKPYAIDDYEIATTELDGGYIMSVAVKK